VAKLTAKQQRFVDEYLIDLNATQAAIRAGYSGKTAYRTAADNLMKPQIKKCVDQRMKEKESALIANQDEVLKYLTSVMRGQSKASVVVVENVGDRLSQARAMEKTPDEKERLKAAELLGKRYGLFDKRDQGTGTDKKNNLLEAISGMGEISTDDLPEVE
jgi:phage terminase small subunit